MVLVKVFRITSTTEPETGQSGKQIELVEVKQRVQPFQGAGDEVRLVRSIMTQLQGVGLFPQVRELVFPKITLFLTEDEYEMLGIRFEVNDTYEFVFKDGSMRLGKPEGV